MTRYELFCSKVPEVYADEFYSIRAEPYSCWLRDQYSEFLKSIGLSKKTKPIFRDDPCPCWDCQRQAFNAWLGVTE